ncbi:unnamed protein product, partial [Cuscuta epithymum]
MIMMQQQSPSISVVSGASNASASTSDDFGFTRALSELSITKEVRGCWFYAEIYSIISSRGWAYLACSELKCFKKLNEDYVCEKCGIHRPNGIWRYTLKLKVRHGKHFVDVMFWDDAARQLLGKVAGDFTEHLDTDNRRTKSCPEAINELVGQEYLFKINRADSVPGSAGRIYVISMVSQNKEKIYEIKNATTEESIGEAYNSDEDLELLFETGPTTVDSNVITSDNEKDALDTPDSVLQRRKFGGGTSTPNDDGSTQGSSNKKLKSVKIEK